MHYPSCWVAGYPVGMVLYWYMCYGSLSFDEEESVEDAIGRAWSDQENGSAVAVGIEDGATFYDTAFIETELSKRERTWWDNYHQREAVRVPTPWMVEVAPPPAFAEHGPVQYDVGYETEEKARASAAALIGCLGDRVTIRRWQ